ncbi:MAG TPA: tetratricopeptide repeat protein [Candidatus Limnocylindria bacterium]|nr:tetratricopeptide repeat protein [Candidatus Limnocylindria bacterium]
MDGLSAGTVTLVFTDIQGSTLLLERLGDGYATLIADHHGIVDGAASRHGGTRIDAAGDGLFYSFSTARGALNACVEAQRELGTHTWPDGADVRVRMGIHTGEPLSAKTGYVGIDVHRAARICGAGHGGQILVSQAARSLIGTGLPDDVGLTDLGLHHLRGIEGPERLYQVVAPGLETDFPPVRSLDTTPNNLPRQLSSFVGRDQEIETAEVRLADSTMLTLTGPGGVGKTRLALEIAAHLVSSFPDGVWLIELASLAEGQLVDDAIASALRVKQRAGADIPTSLIESMEERRLLLILDNCEHLIEPVVDITHRIMRRCPQIQVLATSREALGIPGESLMAVPSMSLPSTDARGAADTLKESDAVRLFVDRARAVLPTFELTDAVTDAVVQICRRLDGIPLAVELAASRIRSLPPAQIAARLDDRFRLLTGGSRTALPRHRTLRATMDWSFELLTEPEQVLFPRLAVFAGSFSIEAAEAVCTDDVVVREDVVDLLAHLVDRSLLVADEGGVEARYRMLETIRDYAQERLADSGEAPATYARHLAWFVDLVDRARPAFFSGPIQADWVTRLAADQDNLRAAMRWAHEDPNGADAELGLASGLWRYWEVRGDLAEGSEWLEQALSRLGGEVSVRRASALTGAGVLAAHRGDYARAAAFHEASLLLNRELERPLAVAAACSNLANIASEQGDIERARTLYAEGIQVAREAGDHQGAAYTQINLADLTARIGEEAEADRLYAETIDIFERFGDRWGVAHASTRLAAVARRRGDFATATRRYSDALAIHREAGDRHAEARVLANLGDVAAQEGANERAESLYQESLALRSQLGDRIGMATVIERLAGVADDRPARAAYLLGAAGAIRESVGSPLSVAALAQVDQFLAGLNDGIGAAAVTASLDDGRRASLAQAVERAGRRD